MKVLLDENLSPNLRQALTGHEVITAVYAGWSGLQNGALLSAAEKAGFHVFVTGDKNLTRQQQIAARPFGIVVLTAHSWDIIEHHVGRIQTAIDNATPGSFQLVDCGKFTR